MTFKVLLPQFGMGMQDAKILRWYKSVGDRVNEGDALCEIEAAKTVAEVQSPTSGILRQILVEADAEAQVRDTIALIEQGSAESQAQGKADSTASSVPEQSPSPSGQGQSNQSAAPSHISAQVEPRARRLAESKRIDLSTIRGSGPNGRITETDVTRAIDTSGKAPQKAEAAEFDDLPISSIRKIIAERLTESKRTIPHFYLTTRCRVGALNDLRQRTNADETRTGRKVSVTDYLIKAVASALVAQPEANVTWQDSSIRRHHKADIAVAVATSKGLITPIIRNASAKTVREISTELADLAQRAREGKLKPDEYRGGSFTISNLGMYGVQEFSAIINPPHAAILAVGAVQQQPIIVEGRVVPGAVMACTLAVDHRVIDGAVAGSFLATFTKIVESANFE